MTIIGGGIRVEHTLRLAHGAKPGEPSPVRRPRRRIKMFLKSKPGQMVESRFDISVKERCCCYLCERYRSLN
jgi:hypothetical protein